MKERKHITDNSRVNHENINIKYHGSYRNKLFDLRWKVKRNEILKRDQNRCVHCGSTLRLHIHHRQYHFAKNLNMFHNPWEYSNTLLITLCKQCHQKGHRLYKVPVKKVSY